MPTNSSSSIERAVKIVLLAEAQQQIREADQWWRQNRDAGDLFFDELKKVVGRLQVSPELGPRYRRIRGKWVHRMLLQKSRYHVYYLFDREQGLVEVHSIWSALKKRGPKI